MRLHRLIHPLALAINRIKKVVTIENRGVRSAAVSVSGCDRMASSRRAKGSVWAFVAAVMALSGALSLLWGAGSATMAWEFSMTGQYEYRYRWIERTGQADLFGQADVTDVAAGGRLVGLAGPNIYNTGALPTVHMPTSNFTLNLGNASGRQMLITRGGFSSSGSGAFFNDSRLTVKPVIKVNSAVRIGSVLTIGGYRNKYHQNAANGPEALSVPPLERYYMSQTSMNAYDTMALVSVEQLFARIRLPWGSVSMGSRSFPIGTGASLAYNTRADLLLLSVPFGPLRISHGIWLARSRAHEAWATVPDGPQKNDFFQTAILEFEQDTYNVGGACILRRFHGDSATPNALKRDENTLANIVWMKYSDGRFFANAEYGWFNMDRYRNLADNPASDDSDSGDQTLYFEGNHLFTEFGAVVGPMKLSMMYALASGPVLNTESRMRNVWAGGYFLAADTPAPFAPGANPKVYAPWPINYQAMAPYEFLMFNTYAGGNNGGWNALDFSFVADDHGMMTDAYCLAGRLDWAPAANLNLWGSYIWAHRLERAGTYLGQYQSSGSLASGSIPNLRRFYTAVGRDFGVGADYVSDGYLGWEMNFGIDWELLENVLFRTRYSRWQPGPWFTETYQSVVFQPDGSCTTTGVLYSRDPIQCFQGSVLIDF